MSSCCPDCKANEAFLHQLRRESEEHLEAVMKSIALRPGTADCDANPLNLDRLNAEALRSLEVAHERLGKWFDSMGVKSA